MLLIASLILLIRHTTKLRLENSNGQLMHLYTFESTSSFRSPFLQTLLSPQNVLKLKCLMLFNWEFRGSFHKTKHHVYGDKTLLDVKSFLYLKVFVQLEGRNPTSNLVMPFKFCIIGRLFSSYIVSSSLIRNISNLNILYSRIVNWICS